VTGSSGTSGSTGVYLGAGSLAIGSTGGTFALDFSQAYGYYGTATTTGHVVTFANPTEGQVYRFLIQQASAGTKTLAQGTTGWPGIAGTNGTWLGGGTSPTLSTAGSSRDVITIWYVNGYYLASFNKNN
jgi:hypothetical protein